MRKRLCTLAQGCGAGLLFFTAAASDMGTASVAQIALGLAAAALLLMIGTIGKRYVSRPRRRARRAAA
ncbi:hypothetical protein NE562_16345 [Butyricicoccus faecihominis]|uniref:hypothetical protein n=1 Tax=Butyricicoccus faecihominis TaxID=1712515 RepID=UPI0024786465|nr:hypothetical protein [Butyricicoccus faecihominis]MCQ5131229.1 hypothetical protein [Butyricicoccus faecihominis]